MQDDFFCFVFFYATWISFPLWFVSIAFSSFYSCVFCPNFVCIRTRRFLRSIFFVIKNGSRYFTGFRVRNQNTADIGNKCRKTFRASELLIVWKCRSQFSPIVKSHRFYWCSLSLFLYSLLPHASQWKTAPRAQFTFACDKNRFYSTLAKSRKKKKKFLELLREKFTSNEVLKCRYILMAGNLFATSFAL